MSSSFFKSLADNKKSLSEWKDFFEKILSEGSVKKDVWKSLIKDAKSYGNHPNTKIFLVPNLEPPELNFQYFNHIVRFFSMAFHELTSREKVARISVQEFSDVFDLYQAAAMHCISFFEQYIIGHERDSSVMQLFGEQFECTAQETIMPILVFSGQVVAKLEEMKISSNTIIDKVKGFLVAFHDKANKIKHKQLSSDEKTPAKDHKDSQATASATASAKKKKKKKKKKTQDTAQPSSTITASSSADLTIAHVVAPAQPTLAVNSDAKRLPQEAATTDVIAAEKASKQGEEKHAEKKQDVTDSLKRANLLIHEKVSDNQEVVLNKLRQFSDSVNEKEFSDVSLLLKEALEATAIEVFFTLGALQVYRAFNKKLSPEKRIELGKEGIKHLHFAAKARPKPHPMAKFLFKELRLLRTRNVSKNPRELAQVSPQKKDSKEKYQSVVATTAIPTVVASVKQDSVLPPVRVSAAAEQPVVPIAPATADTPTLDCEFDRVVAIPVRASTQGALALTFKKAKDELIRGEQRNQPFQVKTVVTQPPYVTPMQYNSIIMAQGRPPIIVHVCQEEMSFFTVANHILAASNGVLVGVQLVPTGAKSASLWNASANSTYSVSYSYWGVPMIHRLLPITIAIINGRSIIGYIRKEDAFALTALNTLARINSALSDRYLMPTSTPFAIAAPNQQHFDMKHTRHYSHGFMPVAPALARPSVNALPNQSTVPVGNTNNDVEDFLNFTQGALALIFKKAKDEVINDAVKWIHLSSKELPVSELEWGEQAFIAKYNKLQQLVTNDCLHYTKQQKTEHEQQKISLSIYYHFFYDACSWFILAHLHRYLKEDHPIDNAISAFKVVGPYYASIKEFLRKFSRFVQHKDSLSKINTLYNSFEKIEKSLEEARQKLIVSTVDLPLLRSQVEKLQSISNIVSSALQAIKEFKLSLEIRTLKKLKPIASLSFLTTNLITRVQKRKTVDNLGNEEKELVAMYQGGSKENSEVARLILERQFKFFKFYNIDGFLVTGVPAHQLAEHFLVRPEMESFHYKRYKINFDNPDLTVFCPRELKGARIIILCPHSQEAHTALEKKDRILSPELIGIPQFGAIISKLNL